MIINLKIFEQCLINEVDFKSEIGTRAYVNEIDRLIDDMIRLKSSLRSGKNRHFNRKEASKIQGAVEALRFIKRKAEKELEKNLLSEGGRKIQHLPSDKKASLSPEVVTQASSLYKSLIDDFNAHLRNVDKEEVIADKPVGSTFYYQEDLKDNTDTVYGDIDFLVSFPPVPEGGSIGDSRRHQARVEREYEKEFLNFLNSSAPDFVDVELTGELSPTMVVLTLPDGKKVQVDLIATVPKYRDWMLTRWVPERGVKGYVGGNLYKALGDILMLSIGDQGVLARTRDGKRVPSNRRGKDVQFTQVSKDPMTFFKDIVVYLAGDGAVLTSDLEENPGMNPSDIKIADIASGIKKIAINLESNSALPDGISDANQMLTKVLERFKSLLAGSVSKKAKPTSDGSKISDEKLNKLVKMNAEQYNNVENLFFN